MTDKYEKVEGMSVGQVVDAMINGEEFYFYQGLDSYHLLTFELMNFKLGIENIYSRREKPWLEGIGNEISGAICWVWDDDGLGETIRCIVKVNRADTYKFVDYAGDVFQRARPLTQAEKDAIIAEG